MKFFVYGSGATFYCLVMEPTQFNRSRSHIRDLELPEPSKQVAAPQHWYFQLKLLTRLGSVLFPASLHIQCVSSSHL